MDNEASPLQTRWMIRADLEQVCAIEALSYEFPWESKDFLDLLRERNVIGNVGVLDDEVVCYLVYENVKGKYYINNLTVAPQHRRKGLGRRLLDLLKKRLAPNNRTQIEIHVRDSSLESQLFLRRHDFQAVEVCKDWYSDQVGPDFEHDSKVEDAYRFVHHLVEASEPALSAHA